jgi:EmrB/QacA subfamily drug resistance transporter
LENTRINVQTKAALNHREILIVFSGLLLGMLLAALDQTIVATALPTIVSDLGGLNELSWVVTAYILASTASTPLWGKIGDLMGRKRIFQAAIVLFLLGSAASGLSQNMGELITFRAMQGLGAGGLMVTAMAIVGDIVSARDRGKYQGIFGAVFAVSSIVGPLLGGFIVQNFSWHWVFYINVPIGIVALIVTGAVLPRMGPKGRPVIDYLGTALIASAATALVLITSLGGVTYAWDSTFIISLGIAAVILIAAFIFVERRVKEPVLPLRLFRNPVFSMTSAIGFIVGFAMFGAITFLPLYLQVVERVTPTDSGLRLLPMLAGMLLTSIVSGMLITRWGRYKIFPIAGTAVMGAGLYLLSLLKVNTSILAMSVYMFVLGFGLGMVMQVLIIAVQNAVEFRDLGTATSGATFFRSIGSAFGVAVFGEIFAHNLSANLAKLSSGSLPAGFNPEAAMSNPQLLQSLPLSVIGNYLNAFAQALHTVFLYAIPVAVLGFILSWFLKENPLRMTTHIGSAEGAAAMEMPTNDRGGLERKRLSMGLLLAAIANQAQREDADPGLLASLSAGVDGRLSHEIPDDERGRIVAQEFIEPLALELILSSFPRQTTAGDGTREHSETAAEERTGETQISETGFSYNDRRSSFGEAAGD